jgi:hypothetical protein
LQEQQPTTKELHPEYPMSLAASVVRTTGQSWKFVAGLAGLLVGSFAPLWPATGLDWTSGTILAIAGYGFACLAIRCPACGKRWFWEAALRPELYAPLARESACPHCRRDFPHS